MFDKFFFNDEWKEVFHSKRVSHLNKRGTNHCSLFFKTQNINQSAKNLFRFFNILLEYESYL